LEPSKMPSLGKRFEGMTKLLKKWLRVKNSKWYKKGTDALVSRWNKAVEFDGDIWELSLHISESLQLKFKGNVGIFKQDRELTCKVIWWCVCIILLPYRSKASLFVL
jgi:hypothetical protein